MFPVDRIPYKQGGHSTLKTLKKPDFYVPLKKNPE